MESDRNSAFTLVEIIIVLSILAILTTTSIVGYGSFMQNTRDSRREADLQSIQTSLQEYRKFEGRYPGDLDDLITSNPPYMEELPKDPKDGQDDYGYQYSQNDNTFILSALLENGQYFQINPYGAEFVASNPMETIPTTPVAFATNPPTIAPANPTFTKTYKYYASIYMKSYPYGDLYHYQYSNIVLNNVTNSEARVKIYIKDFDGGSNLITDEPYLERTIPAKGHYNSYGENESFLGINTDDLTETGKIRNNITTSDPHGVDPDHDSALGWVEIESNKPLAGYNRILLFDGPGLKDNLIDFDDEALETQGHKQTYYPVYLHDMTTGDGLYQQFTDLHIVNPHKTQGTNVTVTIKGIDGSSIGSTTLSLSAHSAWTSWSKASWQNIINPLTSGVGSLEFVSDTTDILVSVRYRITDPNDNGYPAANPNSSDAYFARTVIFEDESSVPAEKASTELVYPLYLKRHVADITDRWQWSNVVIQNMENADATATVEIYHETLGSTPYHTIPINIPALGFWSSYGKPVWQPDDSTYPVPTTPATNPDGIPVMDNVGNSWGIGWLKIVSDTNILALNRTTIRTETTNLPSDRDPVELLDDELFMPLTDTSTKLYEMHYLRNWGGGIVSGRQIRQFTNPVLINPNSDPADVSFTLRRVDDGSEIKSFSVTIDPYSWWNAHVDPDWYITDPTWSANDLTPTPNPLPDATNAWTEISSTQPIFGMHRMRFQLGNTTSNANPNTEIYLFDDDNDALYYANDIYACAEDADCNAGESCSDGECQ